MHMKSLTYRFSIALALSLTICSGSAFAQRADNEYQVGAILWTQSSGEKAALAYQAFSLARLRIDRDFRANRQNTMRRAVIGDVDETGIDYSRYHAMLVE